jgi:hypothetical protein
MDLAPRSGTVLAPMDPGMDLLPGFSFGHDNALALSLNSDGITA